MRFKKNDRVVLNKDFIGIPKGTEGTVDSVNEILENYWVLFDGQADTVMVDDGDLE
jgi:hypothetical protein